MRKILYVLASFAIYLFSIAPVSGESANGDNLERNPNCVTFQGGPQNFGAVYKDPETQDELESVLIFQGKDPDVYRKTNKRGLLRKFCREEIVRHLGSDRAEKVLGLSD